MIALIALIAVLLVVAVFCASVAAWIDRQNFPRPDGGEESGPGSDSPARATQPPPVSAGRDRNRTDEEFDPDEAH